MFTITINCACLRASTYFRNSACALTVHFHCARARVSSRVRARVRVRARARECVCVRARECAEISRCPQRFADFAQEPGTTNFKKRWMSLVFLSPDLNNAVMSLVVCSTNFK